MHIRPPAVAGMFYPDDEAVLAREIRGYLAAVPARQAPAPKVLIVPHAGYIYSGAVAAHAYARLAPARATIRRVVLLGPAHRVPIRGLALPVAEAFATPLGAVRIDAEGAAAALKLPQVSASDVAHNLEHSLEVQVPFLQSVLDEFTLVPVVVGDADADDVARVIEALRDDDTLIVVSSDLSHYHAYADCQTRDRATSAKIEALRGDQIGPYDACGAFPLRGLLKTAQDHDWRVATLDLRNSGDTAGDRTRVVGYGAYAFY